MNKFNLNLSNVPIINLRKEFEGYISLVSTEKFKNELYECFLRPVKIPNLIWSGMPDDLLTLMLQRSILGLESYLGAAVEYELTKRKKLSEEVLEKLKNPFSLKGGGTVGNFYEKMPELIDKSFKLSNSDPQLFDSVKTFYSEIRNPIFHGAQIRASKDEHRSVVEMFELIHSVYHWVDTWYSAFPGDRKNPP